MEQYCKVILTHSESAEGLSMELNIYGSTINSLGVVDEKTAIKRMREPQHLSKSRILCHFSQNDFFIPDRYIQNHLYRLAHLPIVIIHGRNDHVTPISFARSIANNHNNIVLKETKEGHSAYSKENKDSIFNAIKNMMLSTQK